MYLPGEQILAAGDLLEDTFPYFGDSYPSGWARALEQIADLDAAVILPAHGPVLRDRELLEIETRLLQTLTEEVGAAVAKGLTHEETQDSVTLGSFRTFFTGGDPDRFASFEQSVRAAVERTYREVTGSLPE